MKVAKNLRARLLVLCAFAPFGLDAQQSAAGTPPMTVLPNQLTAAEFASGWKLLFNGLTLRGWRGLGVDSIPTAHWKVENGNIRRIPSSEVARGSDGEAQSGDLVTEELFEDFELSWEWKVAPGANSGLKYNVSEEFSLAYAKNHALGFEYRILDDSLADDNKISTHRAGALYGLIAPNELKKLYPAGEWNHSMVVMRGNYGEHWLNGALIVEYELGTPSMDSLLTPSKYRSIPGFADRRIGRIALQDHGNEVHFRSIKVRPIR